MFLHAIWCSWKRFFPSEWWPYGHENGWWQVSINKAFLHTTRNWFLKSALNLISLKDCRIPITCHTQHYPYIINQFCLILIKALSVSLDLGFWKKNYCCLHKLVRRMTFTLIIFFMDSRVLIWPLTESVTHTCQNLFVLSLKSSFAQVGIHRMKNVIIKENNKNLLKTSD